VPAAPALLARVPAAVAAAALAGVRADVPVDPDAETARRWAREELADPIYHQGQNLLGRLLEWLADLLETFRVGIAGVDGRAAAVLLGVVLLVAILVVLLVAGPVRRARRLRTSTEVFVDDTRTAAEMRAAADAAALAGRWHEAVVERFRAILRSLEERAVLDDRPGWTADEATREAGAVLPTCAEDLRRASRLFDDVHYGDARADADDDAWLRGVDAAVQQARPVPRADRGAGTPADATLAVPR
jgi:hypothetical protein